MRLAFICALVCTVFSACGPSIYKSAGLKQAIKEHKTVAILPAYVTTKLRPNERKRMTADQLDMLNEETGFAIQQQMQAWLLRRSDKYKYTITFQDIAKTNELLNAAGIYYKDLATIDRAKLTGLLNVDAVMQNKSYMDKPMSDGAAIAVAAVFGVWGSTNQVKTIIDIHSDSGSLLWQYEYLASGSIGTSPTRLVDALMRNASKKFPYSLR